VVQKRQSGRYRGARSSASGNGHLDLFLKELTRQ
jgi:hypothetical protein